ncbi:MAG: N-acetylmuramoyl-L-alanine amidase [bacterium]
MIQTKIVAVSKGHRGTPGSNTGAVGIDGLSEFNIVTIVGNAALERLAQMGIPAVEVPRTRVPFRLKFVADLFRREPKPEAVALIDIHANAFNRAEACGTETFVSTPGSKSHPLATFVNRAVVSTLSKYDLSWVDRGVKTQRFLVFSKALARAVGIKGYDFDRRYFACLLEIGFITNPEDASVLTCRKALLDVGHAIVEGVAEWRLAYDTSRS